VGWTGTLCQDNLTPQCAANRNPAALFSAGESFGALWAQNTPTAGDGTNVYGLIACVRVGGKWYGYFPE